MEFSHGNCRILPVVDKKKRHRSYDGKNFRRGDRRPFWWYGSQKALPRETRSPPQASPSGGPRLLKMCFFRQKRPYDPPNCRQRCQNHTDRIFLVCRDIKKIDVRRTARIGDFLVKLHIQLRQTHSCNKLGGLLKPITTPLSPAGIQLLNQNF